MKVATLGVALESIGVKETHGLHVPTALFSPRSSGLTGSTWLEDA
ncbi:hypothetical protein SJ05684_c33460 [Sinorhizobium sojae CCBAU 05684]|uniref:Uncharacterized protein n=1 Tax=Sinorhizobium sojae CCBAU 05684 TaxID=716928 RepID=A0A249PFS5_9HYPH|nr:hypothetical protein SJ05684_c33460 [Sinorhizobium sojae CCBAU 05684]